MLIHPCRLLALALLLALSGCNRSSSGEQASSSASPATWKEISSPEGRFSVLMLPNPKQEKSQTTRPDGKIDTVSYLASTPEGRAYSVAYSDYPEAWVKSKSPDETLNSARDGAVARIKGKLLSELKVTMDGAAGRELFITSEEEPLTVQTRMTMVDGRLYVLQALSVGAIHNVPDPDADRFFNSFRLAKK